MESYRKILETADAHFARVLAERSDAMSCRRGCTMCCHGLFEITAADVAIIAEGLERLAPKERESLVWRARRAASVGEPPDLRSCSDEEKQAYFDRTSTVPCPALGEDGGCSIYESRPLVCRTFGLPLREGSALLGEVCELNFQEADDATLLDAAWDLEWEDVIASEDQYTIPEAIVLADRLVPKR